MHVEIRHAGDVVIVDLKGKLAAVLGPDTPGAVVDVHPLRVVPRGHRARVFWVYARFLWPPLHRLRAWFTAGKP